MYKNAIWDTNDLRKLALATKQLVPLEHVGKKVTRKRRSEEIVYLVIAEAAPGLGQAEAIAEGTLARRHAAYAPRATLIGKEGVLDAHGLAAYSEIGRKEEM